MASPIAGSHCDELELQVEHSGRPEDDTSVFSSDDDELEYLRQEKVELLKKRREAEDRFKQEEITLERKLAEARQKKLSAKKLKFKDDVTEDQAQKAVVLALEDKQLRKKLDDIRQQFSHDVTPKTSFDDSLQKVSSLERAKATLNSLKEQANPDKLIETLLTSQDLGELCLTSHSSLSRDASEDYSWFPVEKSLSTSNQTVSSSTPLHSSSDTQPSASDAMHIVSPIEYVRPSAEGSTACGSGFGSTPKSSHSVANSLKHPEKSSPELGNADDENDDDDDDDKFATAQGHLTIEDQRPLTTREVSLYMSPEVNADPYESPIQKLYVDLTTANNDEEPLTLDSMYNTALEEDLVAAVSRKSEPDIIRMTRSSSAEADVPGSASSVPSAPPRRRKVKSQSPPGGYLSTQQSVTNQAAEIISQSSSRTSICSTPPSGINDDDANSGILPQGLPLRELNDTMLDTSEPVLTVKVATLGKRLVSTQDDASFDDTYHLRTTLPVQKQSDEEGQIAVFPLSQHMMKLAEQTTPDPLSLKSYSSKKPGSEDDGSMSGRSTSSASTQKSTKSRKTKLKKFFNKAMVRVSLKGKDHDHMASSSALSASTSGLSLQSDGEAVDDTYVFKSFASSKHKGPYSFEKMKLVQDMSGEHTGPVWIVKFSPCGRLLATGGQDAVIRVWVLKRYHKVFDDMKQKYSETNMTPAMSTDCIENMISAGVDKIVPLQHDDDDPDREESPYMNKIFMSYRGHTGDILDLSWSRNYFLLSSSMDKTVRLWHISRNDCLCCFQHIDFVTAIAFHPRDDRYFLSGSLDGRLRFWNIPEKRVAIWNEVTGPSHLITAINFCQNGRFAVVGTYDGRCIFYSLEQLKYFTTINVRSTRGKNASGHKVTGIEPLPHEDKILVTTNDSRLRLYDLRDLSLTCKYKGCCNESSQIRSSISHDGEYIICGSEDENIYIWRTYHQQSKFTALRRDRSEFWEAIHAHSAVVTAAVFSPNPNLFFKGASHTVPPSPNHRKRVSDSLRSNDTLTAQGNTTDSSKSGKSSGGGSWGRSKANSLTKRLSPVYGYVVVTADHSGSIKVLTKQIV